MSKISILLTLVAFCALCTAYRTRDCAEFLSPPQGGFSFPPEGTGETECSESYEWEFRLKRKQSLKISFSAADLGNSLIRIQVKEFARDEFETIETINSAMESHEVIIQPPNKFVKVTMEGVDGFFLADYEVFFCPLPPSTLTEGSCDNFGYRKYSRCQFQCKYPYLPTSPRAMNIDARCQGSQEWSEDLDSKCTDLGHFEEMCHGEDSENCPFSHDEIAQIFAPYSDLEALLPAVPPREGRSVSSRLQTLADIVAYFCGAIDACARNPAGQFIPCDSKKYRSFNFDCYECRHVHNYCVVRSGSDALS